MPVKACFIYARVSTKAQEEEGYSIPAQLELLRAQAQRHGFTIAQEFTESESAGKTGRTNFVLLVKELKKKNAPKVVLVEKTDRLTRNFYDLIQVDELIFNHGVEFHLVKAARVLGPGMSTAEKTTWAMEVLIAKHFLDNLRDETKKGIRQKIKEGGWCWGAPYGYKMVNGELVIDPDKAATIKRAFELRASGLYSLEAIADTLYQEGHFYSGARPRFSKVLLHKMFENKLYVGQVHYEGAVYTGRHEALVSPDIWQSTRQAAGSRSKLISQKEKKFIFRNALTCAACGSVLCGEEKKDGRYTYYRCWQVGNRQCQEKYVNESVILKAMDDLVQRIAFPADYRDALLANIAKLDQQKRNTWDDEKAKLQGQLSRLQEAFKKAYWDKTQGTISEDFFQSIQVDYQAQMDILNGRMESLKQSESSEYALALEFLDLPAMIQDTWTAGTVEEKAVLVKLLTSRILVGEKEARIEVRPVFKQFISSKQEGI